MLTEILPGTVINNRYRINRLLGTGGFGRTYQAFDNQRFNEPCVLKEFVPTSFKPELLQKSKDLFEREAKVLHKIQHPQVPRFIAYFTENERMFTVQDYVDGKTYSQILSESLAKQGQPLSEAEVRTWLLDILPVLEYIHERKILHRDISLENIMLPYNCSKPMLIDFGVAKENFTEILSNDLLSNYDSIYKPVVGKYGYSPPEQLRLGNSYPSSDIYSLAVCAVVLLTGKMPRFLIDESLKWKWRSQVQVDNGFADILDKMLADVPNERYQTAQEIILSFNGLHHPHKNLPLNPQVNISFSDLLKFLALPHRQLSQIIIKNKNRKEAKQYLEDLLVLQQLEQQMRENNKMDGKEPSQAPIYLNLDFSEYCPKELINSIDFSLDITNNHT
ncbi:hypothetical protein NIES2101_31200 [Calothrix sp. HK-06]|nr:hypothetical protein NIES2101_31200 [Calothrix sp. HK-06]